MEKKKKKSGKLDEVKWCEWCVAPEAHPDEDLYRVCRLFVVTWPGRHGEYFIKRAQ